MADDGGWHGGLEIARSRPAGEAWMACERFQGVLSEFTQRLASPEPMRRETAVSLVQQLDRLGRRMAAEQATALSRGAELDAALTVLTARLEAASAAGAVREAELAARIDRLVAELTEARNARRPAPVRTILAAVAACTALGGAAAGLLALARQPAESRSAPAALEVVMDAPAEAVVGPPQVPIAADAEVAPPRVAAVPSLPPAAAAATKPASPAVGDTYSSVAEALSRGDADAVIRLTRLARSGDAKAQLQLALAHEAGDRGLPRDLAAARLWTLRAASGGDRAAMYNAGQFLMEGEGGPRDLAAAAKWFRRAAQSGVVDAQYNLGVMYETGHGVERNPREALKWFTQAGKAGDATALQKQAALEQALKAPGQPASSPATAVESPAPDAGVRGASVSETQTYLSQKGYYIGPIDGVVTPQLRAAADAYMKDHPAIVANR